MPKDGKRFNRKEAQLVLDKIIPILKNHSFKYEVCGSWRRNLEDVGDLDILVTNGSIHEKLLDDISCLTDDIDWSGHDKIGFQLNSIHVDIKWVPEESWGAGLLHHTGPYGFNIKLRSIAKKRNMLLNEYGLFTRDTKEIIAQEKEEDILSVLFNKETVDKYKNPSKRKTPSWLKHI